jgi:hypothetical protein
MCNQCDSDDFEFGWFDRVMLKSGVIVRVTGLSHFGLMQAEHDSTGHRAVYRIDDVMAVISRRKTH